jgi:ribosomal protein L20
MRINAFCRLHGSTYSEFISKLIVKNLNMSRKTLSELFINHPQEGLALFKKIMD